MTDDATPSDAELATRAAAGDQRAYGELVRRHKDGLLRILRRYAGSPDEAYEAAQEAFIAAWSALARYDPARPFEDSGALMQPAQSQDADEALIERQDVLALDRAIAQLPPGLRAPLVLTAFDGLSQREAGDILGVSSKTVETRVYRARLILAARLDPDLRPAR